jgi:hypothetical protein
MVIWRASDDHEKAAQELLQGSLQAATLPPPAADATPPATPVPSSPTAAAAVAAAAAASGVADSSHQPPPQQQQQQGQSLRSFSCGRYKGSVDALAVLHPHSLTQVHLNLGGAINDSSTLTAAFKRLSNLQQLHLQDMDNASISSALTALAQLSQLTSLKPTGFWPTEEAGNSPGTMPLLTQPVSTVLQQLLAQPLPLQKLVLDFNRVFLPVLDLALLTKLTQLDTDEFCVLHKASVLPAQLQRLTFRSGSYSNSLALLTTPPSQQLQRLSLQVTFTDPQLLLQLAQLPALQRLSLDYMGYSRNERAAAATASAWPLLPQLQELHVSVPDRDTDCGVACIMSGVAAATRLTKLKLCMGQARVLSRASEDAIRSSLAGLRQLRHLVVENGGRLRLASADAKVLMALSNLTHLGWRGCTWHGTQLISGVGTTAAPAMMLAVMLTQLQHLDLHGCGLELGTAEGIACLQAIGRLTQLTWIDLSYNTELKQQGLMQLTGLIHLQTGYLSSWVRSGDGLTADASYDAERFKAVLLQQRQLRGYC